MFMPGQVVTTEPSAARAARDSSRDPSGRRPATSAGGRDSVSSTRVRGTDVSIVVSGKREMVWIPPAVGQVPVTRSF